MGSVVWLPVGFELWSTSAGDQRKGEEEILDIYTLTSSPLRSSKAGYPFTGQDFCNKAFFMYLFFGGFKELIPHTTL